MESYSKKVKAALANAVVKKNCCKRIWEDVINLSQFENIGERVNRINELKLHLKCNGCHSRALAALFYVYGTVTDPSKQYHLEFAFDTAEERTSVYDILYEHGFEMKDSVRKGRYILYVKDSSKIEDLFAMIGATTAAFDLMNAKIIHEVRGNANRQMNCDIANINKSIAAAEQIVEMISEMEKSGYLQSLPKELYTTAKLRLDNTQASMAELGAMHEPAISKSGVNHRLEKIKSLYVKYKSEN